MLLHNVNTKQKRVFITLSFGVLLAIAFLVWLGSQFVEGGEEQHAYIFATNIQSQGWENTEALYEQSLSSEAVVTDFSYDNTAHIQWGDVSDLSDTQQASVASSLDLGKENDETSATSTTDSSGATGEQDSVQESVGSENESEATSSDAFASEADGEELVEENQTSGSVQESETTEAFIQATSSEVETFETDVSQETPATSTGTVSVLPRVNGGDRIQENFFEKLFFEYAHAQEATSSDTTPAMSEEVEGTVVAENEIDQTTPFICEVTGVDCYTLFLEGFGVQDSFSEKEITNVSVQVSLATVAAENVLSDDRLIVKYFLDGEWFLAGELTVEGVRANKDRGGYFEAYLPDVVEWSQLEDLRVAIEYVRSEETPAEVYIDSAWVDVLYRGVDDSVGQENVNDTLQVKDESRLQDVLVVSSDQKLSFDYTDENINESLILKTERASYEAHDGKTIFFNITNTGSRVETFSLRFYTPQDITLGDTQLQKWFYNVPYTQETPEYADTAYFCAEGWSTASTTNQYECASSNEVRLCDSISAEGTNCIVMQEEIGVETITEYRDEFKPVPIARDGGIAHEQEKEGKKLVPSKYQMNLASIQPQEINPGQTLYFALDAQMQGSGSREFYIEAYGNAGGHGLLSPKRQYVSVFDTPNKRSEQESKEDKIHENVFFKKDLLPTDDLLFTFQYNSQRGLFSRLFRGGEAGDYKITRVSVLHETGKRFEVAPEEIRYQGNGEWNLSLEDQRSLFVPGKYTLEIESVEDGKTYIEEKTFYWGVLAINTNKTIYTPGENAYIQIAALTDTGSTICDADLQLIITDPYGNSGEVAVERSGLCDGNNVIDVPDYFSNVAISNTGVYDLELIHFDDRGRILHNVVDSFEVRDSVLFDVERVGPTRIYPPAPYDVSITVRPSESFSGDIIETLPYGFIVEETNADSVVETQSGVELRWARGLGGGESTLLTYTFDAPDISPYLYTTGPLQIREDGLLAFEELREWQIASDAVGNMLIFWEGTNTPAGWTCVSCASTSTFYQQFVMASSTYGVAGGTATHSHTKTDNLTTIADGSQENQSGTTVSVAAHSHTFTSAIGDGDNLPTYRQLRILESTGVPSVLPTGAIVIFDSSVPAGWTRLSAQDTYYVRGEDVVGSTGGSNTHSHTITGTTGAASGGTVGPRGGGAADGAAAGHTHAVSSNTGSVDQQPPYIEVIFASLDATSTPPTGAITMWTDTPPASWLLVSDTGGDFAGRFIKGSASYGATGGSATHSHADVTGIATAQTGTTVDNKRAGTTGADAAHTHTVDVTSFSTEENYPPFVTAIFAKNQGEVAPVFTQNYFRWYDNINAQTPTDPWPAGVADLLENQNISATSTPVKPGDELRLRMSVTITNATTTATATAFRLQYAQYDSSCSAITEGGWVDVGQIASSTIWRGFNNNTVVDGSALSSTTLSVTDVAQTYEEENPTAATPNTVNPGQDAEWDWVLYNNGASSTAAYCFRMVEDDGSVFNSYTRYPTLETNHSPDAPTLSKLFDNEKTASTSPWFEFSAIDDEGERVHYQIQVSTNYNFSTTTIDRNSDDDDSLFSNLNDGLDKPAFLHNNTIRFKPSTSLSNNITYWWRVRAIDPNGSNEYGDWSEKWSFTVDTNVDITTWYQTTEEQFDTNTLVGTDALVTDEVALATGSSTGSIYSSLIDFDWTDIGTIWGEFSFNDTEDTGDIRYYVEYLTSTSSWSLIPDTALSGNSSGFDLSPISLTSLDTNTYNVIRLRADFDEIVSGNPTLQDWTVEWGTRVETPTLTELFDNEKTSTTTPTFEFSTTDPDGDELRYQISWSTDYNFTSSTTKTSNVDTGFIDTTSGDTDPFTSGDIIEFTIQPSDALSNNSTYWWRVRAIDPNGGNAWSLWSEKWSFTVDTSIAASTWFQTTSEQFDTDTLSGLYTTASDGVTVATTTGDAMIAYAEGSVQTPQYRLWDGETKSWGNELSAQSVGAQINWVVLEAGISRDEYALATLGIDADVNVQIYSDGVWGNIQELTAAVGNTGARGFDLAYETTSGDLLAVACDGDSNPTYYTWDGSTWTGPSTLTTTGTDDCEWIQLASDPASGSNEIIMLMLNSTGAQYEALVWNGSTWGSSQTQGSMSEAGHEGMAVEYEDSGNQAVIVSSNGNSPNMAWSSWDGSTWTGPNNVNVGGMEFGTLKRDDGTDNMILCSVDDGTGINALRWTGAGWAANQELDGTANSKSDRPIDCEYEVTTGRDGYIMAAYSDATNARYQTYNGTTWSAEGSVSTITDSDTVQLRRTGDGTILGVFFDGPNTQYDFSYWVASTTSWSTAQTLEDTPSVTLSPYKEPFMIAPQNPQSSGVLLSDDVDFDEGLGPFWDQASWTDSTPGSSDILYQVQYYDTASSTWKLVPDSFIPNNSVGTSTSPIDLSSLSITTHNQIRLRASFSCVAGVCPELSDWTVQWAEGITVSGTALQYDRSTPVADGQTVAVAVNGDLQSGKTGTTASGSWSISNVTVFAGDVVTVFLSGVADSNEAVAVAKYDGTLSMTGIELYERHLSLGSDDNQTISNTDLGQYDASVSGSNDIFHDVLDATNDLYATSTGTQNDVNVYIKSGNTYRPDSTSSGNVQTHDIVIDGTLRADANTLRVGGSWDNNGIFTANASTVIFNATSSTESIDSTGATTSSFFNATFGESSGSATWNLVTDIDVNGDMLVSYGTVSPGSSDIALAGDLTIDSSGIFSRGTGTTTFDGSASAVWTDNTAAKQNIGVVVIDGSLKSIQLGSDVKGHDLVIGADDSFDVTNNHYDIELTGSFTNNNSFVPRQGTVLFSATSTGEIITIGGSSFYDLAFNGVGGEWTVQDTNMTISNDLSITNGSVILPTGSTTIGGSLSNSASFSHTIGTVRFNSNTAAETIDPGSSPFYNLLFDNVSGGWTFSAFATSTNDFTITNGSVTLPSTRLSVGGSYTNNDTFTAGSGEVFMYSTLTGETITAGGSAFYDLTFDGVGGEWTFQDASATIGHDLVIVNGEVILPTTTTTVSGSLSNSDTFTHTIGELVFNSATTTETVDPGNSTFYDVTFNNSSGGWTIVSNATSTNDWTLQDAALFNVSSRIEVQGQFTNSLDGTVTDWSGSTLYLNSGSSYTVNTKLDIEERYDTLQVGANTDITLWNSSATTTTVDASGSVYSQDHNALLGDLYIWGDYRVATGTEYWSYATDFDGTDISGSPRQVDVRFASGASATIESGATLEMIGTATSTTTVDSQSGTYSVVLSNATINAQYYSFRYLDTNGLQLLASTTVASLDDGDFELALPSDGGTLMTIATSTLDTNTLLQIYDVRFATSTGVTSGSNITQNGGSTYWWFRNTTGNFDGEGFDNDTGDPGTIRWDDSSLSITVSGVVYDSDESTPLGGSTCDGSTQVVSLKVNGGGTYTSSCSSTSSAYSISSITYNGDVVLTVFLDGAPGAETAVVVSRTPTSDITDMDLFANKVIVRHEDTGVLDISHMAVYDSSDDPDVPYTATSSLVVDPEHELHVWTGKTFAPGGNVTLQAGGSGAIYDGTLHVDDGATFQAAGVQSHSIGGSWTLDTGASYTAANSTVTFTAATSSKTIVPQSSPFYEVVFNGSGGVWSVDGNMTVQQDIAINAGTLTGASDVEVQGGDVTGDGDIDMTGGTFLIDGEGSVGGSTDWRFANLTFGDGSGIATTTKTGVNNVEVTGVLTVANQQILNAGVGEWNLSGGGTPFVVNGLFNEDMSTFRYSATTNTTVLATGYYELDLQASGAGSPTYTIATGNLNVSQNLDMGDGVNIVSVNANTSDPIVTIDGNITIANNATFTASNLNNTTVGGSWTNDGVFAHGSGTVRFNSGDTGEVIRAGNSPFYNIIFNNVSGGWTIAENATSTNNWSLTNAAGFVATTSSVIEVGGIFTNAVGGASTTWSGATLYINSGTNQTINATSTGADTYGTLRVGSNTDVRMWNSGADSYNVDATGSLYSQDHNDNLGDLYIWGDYRRTSGADYWSYETDFDGTDISGSPRQVDVRLASGADVTITGGSLYIVGSSTATTTVDVQSTGTYGLTINGGNINAQYYQLRGINSDGLRLLGSSAVSELSNGDYLLEVNSGTMITVAGTVINANPLKTFSGMRFATSTGVATGSNITATGASVSSWRFTTHTGNFDGESYDSDPDGDPGYLVWDDSAATITISGYVYSNESGSVSGACDGSSVVRLRVEGAQNLITSCDNTTGFYSISGVSYLPGDVLTVFLDGAAGGEQAANVTVDPFTNVQMDLIENRVIVRHEDADPITIADLSVYDFDQDTDIPFDADLGSPYTLTLPADTKLIIWDNKTFEPNGNVILYANATGNDYDGTIAIRDGATFGAAGTQSHVIGGSWIASSTATFVPAGSTVTFTATTTGKVVRTSSSSFNDVVFNGTGGAWTMQDSNATTTGDVTILDGTVTLPSGIFAIGGSFDNTGGVFDSNGGSLRFFSTSAGETVQANGYDFGSLIFNGTGGAWTMQDSNATTTGDVTILDGTVTLPSGIFAIGGSFDNTGGVFDSNGGELAFYSTGGTETLTAGGSDFHALTFNGLGTTWAFQDINVTAQSDVSILSGAVDMPTGTTTLYGSFTNTGGSFSHPIGALSFVATTTGKSISVGTSTVFTISFNSASGGWTVDGSATSTNDWRIKNAADLTIAPGSTIEVYGDFINSVGGSATDWNGTTLRILTGDAYSINTKSDSGDQYDSLFIGPNTDISSWYSSATSTSVATSSSLYSQDHANNNGDLYIWGDYNVVSGVEYWSYATDFDGTDISGSPRQVNVRLESGATTTFSGDGLEIIGNALLPTTIDNQGSGTYAISVSAGELNARYYQFRNMDENGLDLSGTPTVTSLDDGDFELAVSGGSMVTVSSTVIDQNPSKTISNVVFATSTGVSSGYNVERTGSSTNAWTFTSHSGNYDGESFDLDGATACGQIRWDDSSCLFVSQTHYRWRNDDNGEAVPASEWFDTDWSQRQRIRLAETSGTALSDFQVKIDIPHATGEMQSNFGDLRFTDASGTTTIDYWIESFTTSATATVWVKVPSIPANGYADIYMYYDNVGTVSTNGSATSTFVFFDDFEDGDISEYSGDTSLFEADTSFPYEGIYGLGATTGNENQETTNGIYRTGVGSTVSQGETIRFFQYIDTVAGANDEPCTLFGLASAGNNLAVCLDPYDSEIAIAEDVTSRNESGTDLSIKSVSFSTGWYETEIDWLDTDEINVTVYDDTGAVFATTTATSSSYTSGGIGFSFFSQYGGWDYVTSREYAASDPTYAFGLPQTNSGATWKAAEDTPLVNQVEGENIRLRFTVQNTGTTITDKNFRLQYANRGGSANCLAVPYDNYGDVPTTSGGCGTSPICMTNSSNFTDQASTTQLLSIPDGLTYREGQIMKNPSNQTTGITVPQDYFTEVEYNFQTTAYATSSFYCLRTSDSGSSLANYSVMAELKTLQAPNILTFRLNAENPISLTENSTTTVYATGTVRDLNGWEDLAYATSTIYKSSLSISCGSDPNNCYQIASSSCEFVPSTCTGNTCDFSCSADMYYFADPTDGNPGESWLPQVTIYDQDGNSDTSSGLGVDVETLRALRLVNSAINYGTLSVGSSTESSATTTVKNSGNIPIDVSLDGTDLTSAGGTIDVDNQRYATSSFSYSSCLICAFLTGTSTSVEVDLPKPTATSTPITDEIYWGIEIPSNTAGLPHTGVNTFTPVDD